MTTATLVRDPETIKTIEDIQIGDIWYSSWGYDQTNIDFYKVIGKTATMITLRQIGQKYVESCSDMSEYVMPNPENELFDNGYEKREWILKRGGRIDLDNGESQYVHGFWPAITRHKVQSYGFGVCVRISSFQSARPWDGTKMFQSHWA